MKAVSQMAVFYVYQGETYDLEKLGQYVWSPKLTNNGRANAGYTMMTRIKKGDFILHNADGNLMAISIAISNCYSSAQPSELQNAETSVSWNDDGYRVDTEYHELSPALKVINFKTWLAEHYKKDSAFTVNGTGKQQYMCHIDDDHAIFLIESAIKLQNDENIIRLLIAAKNDIIGEKDSEYSPSDIQAINITISEALSLTKPEWSGVKENQAMSESIGTGRPVPKRDPKRAIDALIRAGFLCEFNSDDRTFLRKNGKPYTEPHHLIPLSKYQDFDYSLDVMENIVSLCSHCHNLLHYGRFEDKLVILEKLYNERKEALEKCGLHITFNELAEYYR